MADFSGLAWVGLDQHWVLQAGPGFDCTVLSKKDPMLQSIECSLGLHQAVVRAQPVDLWVIMGCWLLESDCLGVLYYTWVFFWSFYTEILNRVFVCITAASFCFEDHLPLTRVRLRASILWEGRVRLFMYHCTRYRVQIETMHAFTFKSCVYMRVCNSGCGVFIFAWIFKIILWK